MRYIPSGTAVTNISVAVSDDYTNNAGEKVERTLWFHVSVWGKMGEACNTYLKKGSKVLVEGRLVPDPSTGGPRTWTRQDGSVSASFEVSTMTVRFLSSRGETGGGAGLPGEETEPTLEDNGIPF